jgi:GAF domain-containing protein
MTDGYLAKMLGVACEMAGAQGATLYVVDGPVLKPYIIYNLPAEYIRGIGTVRVGAQCCGRAVEQKRPWIVSDMLTDPLFAEGRKGAVDSPVRAAFSVPVLDGDNAIASIACHFISAHTPDPADIERNEVFARLFAISLRARVPLEFGEPIFANSEESKDQFETGVRS